MRYIEKICFLPSKPKLKNLTQNLNNLLFILKRINALKISNKKIQQYTIFKLIRK